MFGVDSTELAVVAILALIFIGPKDLPKVMRTVGYWVGRIRGMARHFTSGIESMVREAELEEMEKTRREENERIMRVFPPDAHYPEAGQADAMPPLATAEEGSPSPALPDSVDEDLPPEKRPLP
jgi:sec-independent protein translocase protein TatB